MTKQSKSKQLLENENQRLSMDNNSIPEMKDEMLEISSLMPDQEMQSHERADIKLNKTQQISTTNFSSNLNVDKMKTQAEREAA